MESRPTEVLSEHPIEDGVRARVLEALLQIEKTHDVRILFACESGSRGWGFASPDSDYDVRFIYVQRLPWYLRVEMQRDVIELPIDRVLDVNGWELRKALRLMRKSNPTLLEWLDSPVIYRQDSAWVDRMRGLSTRFFSNLRARHHYYAMAKKNYREHLLGEEVRLKKYLYVLRPILAVHWIDAGLGRPPMTFADLARQTVHEEDLLDEINRLLVVKVRSGEAQVGPRWPLIHQFITTALERMELDPDIQEPAGDPQELDAFLLEVVTGMD